MPTLVLQNQSPFECLFNRTPDYDFLCTFGCLCFPFLRPYHAHKLDFRSSPYVFLGYSFSHLGYRCLDSASQRIYVSRHVRFHENVFRLSTASKTPSYFLTAHTLAQLDHPPQFSPGCPTKCLTRQLCHTSSTTETAPPSPTPVSHHTTATQPYPSVTICMFL
jgi:histone deacetylase 1/2